MSIKLTELKKLKELGCVRPGGYNIRSTSRGKDDKYVVSLETRTKQSVSQRGKKHSPETIQKIREAKLGKPRPRYVIERMHEGLKQKGCTDEHRRKLSIAGTGRRHTADTKAVMSEKAKHLALTRTEQHRRHIIEAAARRRGRKMSPETRAKMSKSRTGVPLSESHRLAAQDGLRRYYATKKLKSELSDLPPAQDGDT